MAAELPRPGVEVIQTFRTISPTVVTPTLVASIVGPCKQIVNAVVPGASGGNEVNAEALVNLPAFFIAKAATGSPAYYTLTSGSLKFAANHHPVVTVALPSGSISPATVVQLVNEALAAAGEASVVATMVGTTSWQLRTVGASDFERIEIDDTSTAGILTAFGLEITDSFVGASNYSGYQMNIPETNFPDPRGNMDELSIDSATVRGFLAVSGGSVLFEMLRTQSFLRKGGASTVLDDGNGDSFSPFLRVTGQDFTSTTTAPTAAAVTASEAPTFGSLDGKTLIISDGRAAKEITFDAPADEEEVAAQIQAAFSPTNGLTCTATPVTFELIFTSTRKREDGTTACKGEDSAIVFYGGSALQPNNLLDPNVVPASRTVKLGRITGSPYKAAPGDEVYVDGIFVGRVVQVAPNGNKDVLKVDKQLPLTFTGTTFYIIAKGAAPIPLGTVDRPAPDLIVDTHGKMTLKLGILRDTVGSIVESVTTTALVPARASMYVAYKALRLDVTQRAANAGLLRFDDTIQLGAELEPISTDNPLGLGFYFALLNSTGSQVTGLGVDEVSADEPYGTVDGYTRAAEYLEAFEVYGISPLTHSESVHQIFKTHVDGMSAPSAKGERIVLVNPSKPTNQLDTLVASGTNGNGMGAGNLAFDTGIGNLAALLLAQGIDVTGAIPVSDGLFLDIAVDDKHYSVSAVSGSIITIRTTFVGEENIDGFYSTTVLPTNLIDEAFALRVRGAALVRTDGTPDKDAIASTYASLGQTYLDRRLWMIVPDKCAAILEGIEQIVEGFYMCAANVGAIGQQPPQQSFTNFPITGFTRVIGSNDYFTNKQMDRMAAGGCYIMVQDVPNAPLTARMALTTDLTSIETRTDSITKVVDFSAKFYRRGLKNFIGRFNITQGFLDSLGHVLEGLSDYLKGNGVLIGAFTNNIVQDEAAPDTVLIDITLDVPYPCNYIRVTLVI